MSTAVIKPLSDGFAHLQRQSHIPTSTWRRWCSILNLSQKQAIEIWEEICFPLFRASGRQPETAYFLQLRAVRPQLDILTFKEEVAPIRHTLTFLKHLKDESLTRENVPASLLKFYCRAVRTGAHSPFTRFIDQFIYDLCRTLIITQIVKARQVCLSRILRLLSEARATLDHFSQLACKAPEEVPYAAAIRAFLRPEEDEEMATSEDYLGQFRQALSNIYEVEAGISSRLRSDRLQIIDAFDPFKVALPSAEEAETLSRHLLLQRNGAAMAPAQRSAPSAVHNGAAPPAGVVKNGSRPNIDFPQEPVGNQIPSAPAGRTAASPVEIDEAARLGEMLLGDLNLPADNRRHQENPRLRLAVIGLDKLNQDGNLKDLFVRLRDDGRIAFVENFEDGTYVDLFELREYTPSRVHANAQKKATEEGKSELQKGRKYLFTVGRTNHLFGSSPNEILGHCLKKDNGAPAIYPVF